MKLVLAFFLLAGITTATAQKVHFGIMAEANLGVPKFGHDAAYKPKSTLGYNLGVFGEIPLGNKFTIRPELKYSRIGYKFSGDDLIAGARAKASFINLPVLAQYAVTEKFKVELGHYVGIHLATKSKLVPSAGEEEDDYDDDQLEYQKVEGIKTVDFGIIGGVGYQFTPKLGANIRYALGLSNFIDSKYADGATGRYRVFSLGVSYFIK